MCATTGKWNEEDLTPALPYGRKMLGNATE